jgi:hypothetical protein
MKRVKVILSNLNYLAKLPLYTGCPLKKMGPAFHFLGTPCSSSIIMKWCPELKDILAQLLPQKISKIQPTNMRLLTVAQKL